MGEVNYFLNGKNFKDYGIYVSDSPGLFNELPTKDPEAYEWAEYNGSAVDLSIKRYKSREFELQCFIKGDSWIEMYQNFQLLMSEEFANPGTQRLVIDAFGVKKLAYEVYKKAEIDLKKKFRDGVMYGVFTLKLIEPNPIKKILISQSDLINLSFKSDSEFEIFWGDGTRTISYGNVNEIKDYHFPSYNILSYSIIQLSLINHTYYQTLSVPSTTSYYQFSVNVEVQSAVNLKLYVIGRKNDLYEVVAISPLLSVSNLSTLKLITELKMSDYGKFILKILDDSGFEIPNLITSNPQVKKAEMYGVWNDMTGKEKVIIIAGNVDEIKDLTTNSEILWNRL